MEKPAANSSADEREWIGAHLALTNLARVMKSAAAAKEKLVEALANGTLIATAARIREEWHIGSIRAQPARSGRYVLHDNNTSALGRVSIRKEWFARSPRGARPWSRWPTSSFAWISPQGRTFYRQKTNEFGHVASRRIVMFDVVFLRHQYDPIIDAERTGLRRRTKARSAGIAKAYVSQKTWETEKLVLFYEKARHGTLIDDYNLDRSGAKLALAKTLMRHCGEDATNARRYRTFLRQVDMLMDFCRASWISNHDQDLDRG